MMSASVGHAADVKVFTSVALTAALNELSPIFEQKTGHKLVVDFNLAAVQKKRLVDGERADVIILTRSLMEDLAKENKLAPGNLVNVAGTPVALAARAGVPKPDISTVEAFKQTLLSAQSLTYVPAGASGVAFKATAEKLGLAAALEAKTRAAASGEEVNANVLGGLAAIAVLPVSEILPVQGAALGGVFPADVQTYIVMAGATSSTAPQAAREFLALLVARSTDAVIKAKGMERVQP